MGVNEKMTELADAVRDLTGGTELLTLDEMIQNIRAASATEIINTAEGEVIYLADCATRKLHGLTLYGKAGQNGTPTPEAPIALDIAGNNGNIIVNVDTQTLTVSTPNGLPGIPVTSDGNYTDKNGQQWLCDEIDFARGKYIKRVGIQVFDGSSDESWIAYAISGGTRYRVQSALLSSMIVRAGGAIIPSMLCSMFIPTYESTGGIWSGKAGITVSNAGIVMCYTDKFNTGDASLWTAYLTEHPMIVAYQLRTPTETDLAGGELVAYSALHTNYPQTVIYNDAGAWMSVAYAADTKSYVDGKFAEMANAIITNA